MILSMISLAQPSLQWTARYNGPTNGTDIITDMDFYSITGDVYVTGVSDSTQPFNFVTIKYSCSGTEVWRSRFVGPLFQDYPNAIKYDPINNAVYVAGKSKGVSSQYDWLTIRYNATTGDTVWTRRYNGTHSGNDEVVDIDVDQTGNLYIIGNVLEVCNSILNTKLIKYDPNGTEVWSETISSVGCFYENLAVKIAVDANKLVVIYNESGSFNYTAYARGYYISNGGCTYVGCFEQEVGTSSTNILNYGIDFDGFGNVYITGGYGSPINTRITKLESDVYTVVWQKSYNMSAADERAINITVDQNNYSSYITGYVFNTNGSNDIVTMKLDASGDTIWTKKYNAIGNGNDQGGFVEINSGVNPDVWVSGFTTQASGKKQITTLKYNGSGVQQWALNYGCSTNDNIPVGMFKDAVDNVFISGYNDCNSTNEDYLTLKYCATAPPQPGPITGVTSTCEDSTVTYSISSVSGATSYTWSLPNGWTGSSTTTSISVTPDSSGTISVVANSGSLCSECSSQPRTLAVTVHPLPNVGFTANPSSRICIGTSITLNGTGASTYSWTGGVANNTAFAPTVTSTYLVTGTDVLGCRNTASATITVDTLPDISVDSATICLNSSATLTATGGLTYDWSTGATGSTLVVSPTTNTLYTVTGRNINNCINTAIALVTINSLPDIEVDSATICEGDTTTLTASGGIDYDWSTGGTGNVLIISPLTSSSYTVTGTDLNGCTNSAIGTVTISPDPNITLGSNSPICDSINLLLSANFNSGWSYNWDGPNGFNSTLQNPVILSSTIADSGWYVCTITNNIGCSSTDSTLAVIDTVPHADITISGSQTFCDGDTATLSATSGSSYLWIPDSLTSQSIFTTTSGIYYCIVNSPGGCYGEVTTPAVNITVYPNPSAPIIYKDMDSLYCSVPGMIYQWYRDSIAQPQMTTQNIAYSFTDTLLWHVVITDLNGCSASSNMLNVGIYNNYNVSSFVIYPNPTKNYIQIKTGDQFDCSVKITNILGEVISIKKNYNSDDILYIDFQPGIYFVALMNKSNMSIQKLVVE